MEQHAIPQNVSSYQFKLVGDMTLKQFFQLAGGLLVGLLFYASPLLGIIKWPLAILSGILGAALAFLPLEERPLERWIFAFFKAIYAPTEYFWQKTNAMPKYYQDEPAEVPAVPSTQQDAALKEYLASTNQKTGPLAKLEGAELGFLSTLAGLFNNAVFSVSNQDPAVAAATVTEPEKPKELNIPQQAPVKITPQAAPHLVLEEKPMGNIVPPTVPIIAQQVAAPSIAGNEMISTKQALFSVDAAPPNPPTTPNVVVGQVVDGDRKIIEGAIMEIQDVMGRPIRAVRSNKAGHFMTVTPLDIGKYNITTEKDGFEFTPVSFEANGNLIPPILVSGRKLVE